MVEIRELKSKEEMLSNLSVLQQMYEHLTLEDYSQMLDEMLPHNYGQIAAFLEGQCVGISGYWIHTKLWTGRILEMDNVVVTESHRNQKIGQKMTDFLIEKANNLNCTKMVLDAFVGNHKAHKFYFKNGFIIKGFHFVKQL
jgi:GNAT superfamily N-acetyltransferase